MSCPVRHPTRDEPCVRTGKHRWHRSETSMGSDTYLATNCWPWKDEQ